MDKGYLVKFKNYALSEEGTGKLHYKVLSNYGKCIWGQWTINGNPMFQTTFDRMNKEVPFYLYAFDNNFALLKMKVEKVLRKEDIIDNNLNHLIPSYYSIDTPCANYYLISEINIFPVEEAIKVIVTNSGNNILSINQVNSRSPISVYWDENPNENYFKSKKNNNNYLPPIPSNNTDTDEQSNTHAVYRFKSKTDGKCYIGLTNNVTKRLAHHKNPTNWRSAKEKWKVLYMMFSMYGYENYEFSILHENLTKKEAEYLEAKEIENHNCYYPNGLNVRDESRHLKN